MMRGTQRRPNLDNTRRGTRSMRAIQPLSRHRTSNSYTPNSRSSHRPTPHTRTFRRRITKSFRRRMTSRGRPNTRTVDHVTSTSINTRIRLNRTSNKTVRVNSRMRRSRRKGRFRHSTAGGPRFLTRRVNLQLLLL